MKDRTPLKILVLYTGKMPGSPEDIGCFSDVWNFYLVRELQKHVNLSTKQIPSGLDDQQLVQWFLDLDISGYDAVIALGLRYFSRVDRCIGEELKTRLYPGILCQIHDGSRLDNDPVDVTFTFKNEDHRYPWGSEANRYVRHRSHNVYVGWAADPDLNYPKQDEKILRILVDHTNYGDNPIDLTVEVLQQIQAFIDSGVWRDRYDRVRVRRFDSGQVVDVDFDSISEIQRYDRTALPFTEVCEEHSLAQIFCVTHPESVGLVVLETAMAGALTVTPQGFIPRDRLDTVRHVEWDQQIPWHRVLENIDVAESRRVAVENSWMNVAKRMRDELRIRRNIRGGGAQ